MKPTRIDSSRLNGCDLHWSVYQCSFSWLYLRVDTHGGEPLELGVAGSRYIDLPLAAHDVRFRAPTNEEVEELRSRLPHAVAYRLDREEVHVVDCREGRFFVCGMLGLGEPRERRDDANPPGWPPRLWEEPDGDPTLG